MANKKSRRKRMAGTDRWLALAAATLIVFALLGSSLPARADESLRASLDYAILAQPYQNSVKLNTTGLGTSVAVDRDPSSPYYGTIYSITSGVSGQNSTFDVQRSLDGGRSFDGPYVFDCSWSNLSCGSAPEVAVGNHGAVYAASGGTILRSIDRGLSWGTAAVLSDLTGFIGSPSHFSIATDIGRGAVYVATANSSNTVLVTRSVDEGQTWSTPVAVSGGATGGYGIVRVVALRDNVVVAFLSSSAL